MGVLCQRAIKRLEQQTNKHNKRRTALTFGIRNVISPQERDIPLGPVSSELVGAEGLTRDGPVGEEGRGVAERPPGRRGALGSAAGGRAPLRAGERPVPREGARQQRPCQQPLSEGIYPQLRGSHTPCLSNV